MVGINQAEMTRLTWLKRHRAETIQVKTTQTETTKGRNDSGPKRLRIETTRYRYDNCNGVCILGHDCMLRQDF